MNNNLRLHVSAGFTVLALFLVGCTNKRDEFLYSLGAALFIVFLFYIGAIFLLQHLHQWQWFQRLSRAIRPLATVLSWIAMLAGLVIFAIHMGAFLSEEFKPSNLAFFLGVTLFFSGLFLFHWTRATVERKPHFARLLTGSLSATLGLLYLMTGAPHLSG